VRTSLVLACAVAALVSCRSTPQPSAALGPERPWKEMTHDERLDHMKRVVHPNMKPVFQSFDSAHFADFTCVTCHGSGAEDESFRMPNPGLPRLPGAPDGFERLLAEKPDVVAFMANGVVPAMAAMLGEKPYDPQTHSGFGCFRCHTTK